mgnify:CR=1 FL=1
MTARLIILNACWLAAVIWATFMGYTQFVLNGDGSYVSYIILAVLVGSASYAFRTGKHLKDASWLCETLGFVGTLIGITIGLAGVDVSALQSTDGVIAAGNALFGGMSTAFCSTITGAVAMLWLWSVGKVVESLKPGGDAGSKQRAGAACDQPDGIHRRRRPRLLGHRGR